MGLIQQISLLLTEQSKSQLATDMAAAGAKGVAALRQEFQRKLGDLKADFSQGLIDEPTFRAQARRVAEAFNVEIIKRMDALKAAGQDTSKEYAELGRQIKLASSTGIEQGGLLTKVWGGFKTFVTGLGATMAAAFGVQKLIAFGRASIEAAIESERALTATRGAVESLGLSWAKVGPQVEAAAQRIQASTRFDDEAALRGFTTVLDLTRDYGKSLAALGPIADFAVAKNLSFEEASKIVGQALAGNTKALGRYIPAVKQGADVMDSLGQFAGRAKADLSTFGGGLDFLKNQWGEFTETLGKVFVSSSTGVGALEMLSGAVQGMTEWVIANREQLTRWVIGGLRFAIDAVKATADAWVTLTRLIALGKLSWAVAQTDFARFIQAMLGLVLKLQGGMLALAEALPGDPFAEQIRSAMDRTKGYIGGLDEFIAEKAMDMRRAMGGDDATATKTESLGGALAVNTEAGTRKAGGSIAKFAAEGKLKFGELATAAKESSKEIAEDLDAYFDQQTAATEKAEDDRLRIIRDGAGRINAARDAARVRDLEGELAANQAILDSTTATTDQKRAAFQRSADIQVELAALAARRTLEEGDREAASREAVEERKRQALAESGLTAEQINEEMAKDATTSADQSRKGWLDALTLVNTAFSNLGKFTGGILDGIVSAMGRIVGAGSAIAGGFEAIKTKGSGLLETLTKIGGAAGVIGGALDIIGAGIDIIGGLFPGDKDPGRFSTNRQAREFGARDPTGIFKDGLTAIDFLLLKSPTTRGGGGGWATRDAQENAWATLQALLQDLQRVGRLPQQYAHLLGAGGGTAPTRISPTTSPTPAPQPTSTGTPWTELLIPGFQHGGWVRQTGPIGAHAGELVLPGTLAQQLLNVAGMSGSRISESHVNNNTDHSGSIVVNLYGVMDRDIPQAVVDAISRELGRGFQNAALRRGNARME